MENLLELIHPSADTPQTGSSSCLWPRRSPLCCGHVRRDLAALDAASELTTVRHRGCRGLAWAFLSLLGVEKEACRAWRGEAV